MHKTLEHSDKDCAPSEDAPPLTFGVHFRIGGVCGCLQLQALLCPTVL